MDDRLKNFIIFKYLCSIKVKNNIPLKFWKISLLYLTDDIVKICLLGIEDHKQFFRFLNIELNKKNLTISKFKDIQRLISFIKSESNLEEIIDVILFFNI
jgi:hypothetical protein